MIRQEVMLAGLPQSYTMDFNLDRDHDRFVWLHLQNGVSYEPEVCWVMLRALRPRDVAVDVGANFGYFSLLMARLVGSGGKVYAFEPAQEAHSTLVNHITLNQVGSIIHVSDAAVSDVSGPVQFFYSSDDAAGSCLWDPGIFPGNSKSAMKQRVEIRPSFKLDDLPVIPRLIKIDAEGAEHKILQGSKLLLTNRVPFIVLELNPFGMTQMGTDTEQLRAYLRQFGYSLFFIHQDGRLPTLVPEKTQVTYIRDVVVKNALFSTPEFVAEAWPSAQE